MAESRQWRRLLSLGRSSLRVDVDDELAFHLESRVRDLIASGLSPTAARAEAVRQFGDVPALRDACLTIDRRRFRRSSFRETVSHMRQDLSYALRTLRRSPTFAFMAIGSLALGIGVTTTVFSAVNATLLRPLPYPAADRLVMVYAVIVDRNERGINISWPDYESWRDQNRSFSSLGIWTWSSHALSGGGIEAERVEGAAMSWQSFAALGVRPLLGRTFVQSEDREGRPQAVILGYDLWQRRYGGDRSIVGRAIQLDGAATTVVGVMPRGFAFPNGEQLWVPFTLQDDGRFNRGFAGTIGRLRPGVTFEQAQADLAVVSKRLEKSFPQDNTNWAADPILLRDDLVQRFKRPLIVCLVAVGLVLLVACANVANLMLVRGAGRQREMAVRVAIGAGRRQLVRQLLVESLVLATLGGLIGIALSALGVRALKIAFADQLPSYATLSLDTWVVVFAVLVSIATGLLFGLIPAFRATRLDPTHSLRDGGRGSSEGLGGVRIRSGLVVAEVALSLMLLVGAGLLLKSYRALTATNLGFEPQGVLSLRVSLPTAKYPKPQQWLNFWQELYDRTRALPGVQVVGSANGIPFSGWNVQAEMTVEGKPSAKLGEDFVAHYQQVSPDFFRTIGVPIVRGRYFTPADRDSGVSVGVVNEQFVKRKFPNEDPIGKRVKFGRADSTDPWTTIVGVVRDFRHYGLPEAMGPALYFPLYGSPRPTQTLVIRTSLADPSSLTPAVLGVLRSLDPDVPAYRVQTLEQATATSLWRQRVQGRALAVFAALALGLAIIGIYGVVSYTVAQRTRELGVRMALGATGRDVVRLIVGHGARLALIGVALGIVGALLANRALAVLLYGVKSNDPATYAGVALVLALVAALASWLPALRATRVDPVSAIRTE
jgi:putative ABC transport system permease protein